METSESFFGLARQNAAAVLVKQSQMIGRISERSLSHAQQLDRLPRIPGMPSLGSSGIFRNVAVDMDSFTSDITATWESLIPSVDTFERYGSYAEPTTEMNLSEIDEVLDAAGKATASLIAFRKSTEGFENISPILAQAPVKMRKCIDEDLVLIDRLIAAFKIIRGRIA